MSSSVPHVVLFAIPIQKKVRLHGTRRNPQFAVNRYCDGADVGDLLMILLYCSEMDQVFF